MTAYSEALRAQAAEAIARADTMLADRRPAPDRWAQGTQAPETAAPVTRQPPPRSTAPAPAFTRADFNRAMHGYEKAIGQMFAQERRYWRMRLIEAERRIAELETRLGEEK